MADRVLPSHEITWCETHFAGAVEKMSWCLVWRERGMAGPPDCSLVDRVLVDREAMTPVMPIVTDNREPNPKPVGYFIDAALSDF